MTEFAFRVLEMRDTSPGEWLTHWEKRYEQDNGDDEEHHELIAKHESFLPGDFERIGKWKDGVTTESKWRPNVASVAYPIWMEAAQQKPTCPEEGAIKTFLNLWSDKTYTDVFTNGKSQTKRFGLSRASTLLHFLSGGRYPIFDSRVRTAIARLSGTHEMEYTVEAYCESCMPAIEALATLCGTEDIRSLDKALFSYGALDRRVFKNSTPR